LIASLPGLDRLIGLIDPLSSVHKVYLDFY
jgi:hypothetical protein